MGRLNKRIRKPGNGLDRICQPCRSLCPFVDRSSGIVTASLMIYNNPPDVQWVEFDFDSPAALGAAHLGFRCWKLVDVIVLGEK